MIPPFEKNGYLPPGIHSASIEEVVERFGTGSEQREAQAQSLLWLIPICRRAGVTKVLINGSFVTDRLEPNDVDCVLLEGSSYRRNSLAAEDLRQGLPFLEIKTVEAEEYTFFGDILFSSDRDMMMKGLIEVEL